jgi:anti-anti-sigma regulatory factor
MFQVEADTTLNVLKVSYSQQVDPAQVKQCREQVEVLLLKLRPGFQVLADLSRLDWMEYACAAEIRSIMDLCQKNGVSKVIRVIPDPHKDIGFTVMSLFHYGHDVAILTCETLPAAMERLSS